MSFSCFEFDTLQTFELPLLGTDLSKSLQGVRKVGFEAMMNYMDDEKELREDFEVRLIFFSLESETRIPSISQLVEFEVWRQDCCR